MQGQERVICIRYKPRPSWYFIVLHGRNRFLATGGCTPQMLRFMEGLTVEVFEGRGPPPPLHCALAGCPMWIVAPFPMQANARACVVRPEDGGVSRRPTSRLPPDVPPVQAAICASGAA